MAIRLGSAYGKVEIDSSGVAKGVSNAVNSLETLKTKAAAVGQAMQQLGGLMTAAFTVPLALAGRSALNIFQEYEKAMNILGAVSGATAEEMQKLSKLAKDLGADLTLPGTSAADAAQAMSELAKAGMSVNDIIAASKGVLQMSAAGNLSNAEAAEIAANALNAFNLSGEEAIRIADLLAAGANSSSAEVKEMADSLQMSSAVFANAGMEIEELIASISIMANAGIQGSDAGTSLKQMLLALQAPSDDAIDIMNELGISIYDAQGNMKTMREIIEEFNVKMRALTQEERNYALAKIFGSDAIRAANIVLLGGVDAYDQMLEKVTQTGAAADLASAMMKGLTGAIENVKSAFETASIAAIEPFKEDLAKLLEFVAKALNAFSALPEPVRKIIVVWLALLAVTGPILVIFGTILSTVASIITAFGTLGISIGAVTSAVAAAVSALLAIGGAALSALGALLLLAIGPAILYLAFKNNFMGITTTAKQLWFIIKFAFSEGWKWLVNAVQQGGMTVWNGFRNMIQRVVQAFRAMNWRDLGKYMIMGIINGLLGGIPALVQAAIRAAKAVLSAVKTTLRIKSPSEEFMKIGAFSGQGFQAGLAKMMDPATIARTMAKPSQSFVNSQSQSNTMYFGNGLTLRDVDALMSRKIGQFTKQLTKAVSHG